MMRIKRALGTLIVVVVWLASAVLLLPPVPAAA